MKPLKFPQSVGLGARLLSSTALLCVAQLNAATPEAQNESKPNIVIILADDMGIDSVASFNDKNRIPTPHLDRLAKEGVSFSDAHSGSSLCTPTRYGILTGRYAWRSRLKKGIVKKWERPLIAKDRLTFPKMLKNHGYHTACIGKWHLGWSWPKKGGGFTSNLKQIDFSKKIGGGPTTRGFDIYFGDDVPNWPPFAWIENDQTVGIPDTQLTFPDRYHSNNGIGVKGWKFEPVLPKITQRAVKYIGEQARKNQPFFLYFALTSPHTPIAPSKAFQGKSGISRYADFLMETDWSVGQVLGAIQKNGIAENTLVIFTADNGTSPKCDFKELKKHHVDLQNHWRGMKGDTYEGGHRVPMIVRWQGKIKPGAKSNRTVCTTDLMATAADAVGLLKDLPNNAAEDSFSFFPTLMGKPQKSRPFTIHHSSNGSFVIRKGKWKLILCPGSGGWSQPTPGKAWKNKALPPIQLYNLSADPKETKNVQAQHSEVVQTLMSRVVLGIRNGRTTPGGNLKNDTPVPAFPKKIIERYPILMQ